MCFWGRGVSRHQPSALQFFLLLQVMAPSGGAASAAASPGPASEGGPISLRESVTALSGWPSGGPRSASGLVIRSLAPLSLVAASGAGVLSQASSSVSARSR